MKQKCDLFFMQRLEQIIHDGANVGMASLEILFYCQKLRMRKSMLQI